MTREERVFNLKVLKSRIIAFDEDDNKQLKALQETIKELEQEPKTDALDNIRAEIEQINEFDHPKDDRTMSKFKGIVLDIIRKHTGIPSDEEMKYRMENCCCIGKKVRE